MGQKKTNFQVGFRDHIFLKGKMLTYWQNAREGASLASQNTIFQFLNVTIKGYFSCPNWDVDKDFLSYLSKMTVWKVTNPKIPRN